MSACDRTYQVFHVLVTNVYFASYIFFNEHPIIFQGWYANDDCLRFRGDAVPAYLPCCDWLEWTIRVTSFNRLRFSHADSISVFKINFSKKDQQLAGIPFNLYLIQAVINQSWPYKSTACNRVFCWTKTVRLLPTIFINRSTVLPALKFTE